jgi:hypothetical protein
LIQQIILCISPSQISHARSADFTRKLIAEISKQQSEFCRVRAGQFGQKTLDLLTRDRFGGYLRFHALRTYRRQQQKFYARFTSLGEIRANLPE